MQKHERRCNGLTKDLKRIKRRYCYSLGERSRYYFKALKDLILLRDYERW